MEAVGRKLNIKGHHCGIATKQFLYAPCDIEGHLGGDSRFYVVGNNLFIILVSRDLFSDYARVFPPTADEEKSYAFAIIGCFE
jgi:hypothetical protein